MSCSVRTGGLHGAKQEWVDGGQALDGDLYGAHVRVMEEISQGFDGLRGDYGGDGVERGKRKTTKTNVGSGLVGTAQSGRWQSEGGRAPIS